MARIMNLNVLNTLSNLALGKPATQSSVSRWSTAPTPEGDASVATNGDTSSAQFFHTDFETAPWWQVDLEDDFVISRLRLFNRRDIADRLRKFSILVSRTAAPDSWLTVFTKTDDAVFGAFNDCPYVVEFDTPPLARYVRVRKDDDGCLHFRECEILGYAPDDEQRAALISRTEQELLRLKQEREERLRLFADGRSGVIVEIDSLSVFVDTQRYSPAMINTLRSGRYEGGERHIVKNLLRAGDRVLEIGTAIGAVSMTAARIVGPGAVMTFDANPDMVQDARRNFAANNKAEISANLGVMRNRALWVDGETDIDFFVAQDFWASRLFAAPSSPDIVRVVKVPLVRFEDKIADHRANVLICDIEGGEADLLEKADLESIRMILMEVHYTAGRARIDAMMRSLIGQGFNVNFDFTGHHVVVLERAQA
ncbi:FkbM family methyltransferase [Rhodoblastus acidophilus]|uniref:FkbM family methyltransferase n=2 Tax=Rhodoblastus acidophilus TaxID=1074 RepID=A0A6N8DSY6_RHOAC|nr:FkbM family methyltransferase [Rhodoblastus acidophilus]